MLFSVYIIINKEIYDWFKWISGLYFKIRLDNDLIWAYIQLKNHWVNFVKWMRWLIWCEIDQDYLILFEF